MLLELHRFVHWGIQTQFWSSKKFCWKNFATELFIAYATTIARALTAISKKCGIEEGFPSDGVDGRLYITHFLCFLANQCTNWVIYIFTLSLAKDSNNFTRFMRSNAECSIDKDKKRKKET